MLLATSRDWFASALQAVLEPEGFAFRHIRTGEAALRDVSLLTPDAVIIDEGLPDIPAAELCRRLGEAGLETSVPILVYSPDFWHESRQAEAMQAGAWDVIREPIRSKLLVAKLRRLLQIRKLIEVAGDGETGSDASASLLALDTLVRMLPAFGSIAERSGATMSCAVLGPTVPSDAWDERTERRSRLASLCEAHARGSDLRAGLGEEDIAIVAFGADTEGTSRLVGRLRKQAEMTWRDSTGVTLSAGIAELPPSILVRKRPDAAAAEERVPGPRPTQRIASLSRLAAAQQALADAREAGGGIRIAVVP